MKQVIGLLGCGTVGGGVDAIAMAREDLTVKKILLLYPQPGTEGRDVYDFAEIENDPEITVVAEAMGGVEPAFTYASRALKAGKHFVTANKALIAAKGAELAKLAVENGVSLRCTAAVGGGIPWLTNLTRCRRLDTIRSVRGIMNGTTNFIMNAMHTQEVSFDDVLKKAQSLGYAEANPSADIDGWDTQRKIIISAGAAFDKFAAEAEVDTFGIRNVTAMDVKAFQSLGYVCKLVAVAKDGGDGLVAYVEPTLLGASELEAAVPSNFNLITYDAEYFGVQSFYGQGAGRFPTAANVVQDILDLADCKPGFYTDKLAPAKVCNDKEAHPYYVRTTLDAWSDKAATKGDGWIITEPIAVSEMHAWAKKAMKDDPALFFAGIQ